MLTQVNEPYEIPPQPGEAGILGLFATEFRVWWADGAHSHFAHFDQARRAESPDHGEAVQIDRIETIWVRGRERRA